MITGKTYKDVTVDDIMDKTNQGYDIYKYYVGNVSKQMDRPWGKRESKPSFSIFPIGGTWRWKDFATEESGGPFDFVMKFFSLSFKDAKNKVMWDFGMSTIVNPKKAEVTWSPPYHEDEPTYARINFNKQPFKKQHHEFWNIVQVSEEDCKKEECWAVKDLAIKGKRVFIGKDEAVFAFYCAEEDAVKIYFPERSKGEKFRNNVSYHHLWGFNSLQECESLLVQKSPKDRIVTLQLTPCVTATQAEAVKIFDTETVGRINSVTKSPIIWYGSDWDGVKKCKEITDTNKWRYINTEKKYLPEVNDTYGIVRMWNLLEKDTGLKKLEEFMKKKKVI